METNEIRALSTDEIYQHIDDFKKTLFNLRFQHEIGQLENPKKILHTKRDVARLKTILADKL